MSNKRTVYHDICVICLSKDDLVRYDCLHNICGSCRNLSKQHYMCAFCNPVRKTQEENLPKKKEKGCLMMLLSCANCG